MQIPIDFTNVFAVVVGRALQRLHRRLDIRYLGGGQAPVGRRLALGAPAVINKKVVKKSSDILKERPSIAKEGFKLLIIK